MTGHIRKRGKDSWTVVVPLDRDPVTGKRRQLWRTVRGTKKDAQRLLTDLLHQRDTGIDAPPGRMTVGDYLRFWLDRYAAVTVEPATLLQYRWAVRQHLTPALGGVLLTKLRPAMIQAFYAEAVSRGRADGRGGLSGKTVQHIHRLLREALDHAVKWQMLTRNPADAVTAPRAKRYEPPVLSPGDVQRVLDAASGTAIGALIHTAVMTGLRRGELQGLRWQDVDLEGRTLHLRQAAQRLSGQGWTFRQPKTPGSRRSVALARSTVAVLREHRLQQVEQRLAVGPGYRDLGLVFASPLGTPIDPSHLRRLWKRIAAECGLPAMRLHDLRHTHATLMLLSGVNPKVVSERLGHSTVGITLDTYTSVLPNLQQQAADDLDQLLAAGGKR